MSERESIVVNVTIFKMKIISNVYAVTMQPYVAVCSHRLSPFLGRTLRIALAFVSHNAHANGITESKMDLRIHITHGHV